MAKISFKKTTNLKEYIEERYIPEPMSGCWIWIGQTHHSGYGMITMNGKIFSAHRLSYEVHVGPIPEKMFVCHKCDVRICCNPIHMFLGTQQDNVDDMRKKGRARSGVSQKSQTHCKRGHPLSGDNLYVYKCKKGLIHRNCRICRKNDLLRFEQKRLELEAKSNV